MPIAAPVGDVFAFLLEPTNVFGASSGDAKDLEVVHDTATPAAGRGARYRFRRTRGQGWWTVEYLTVDPPRRIIGSIGHGRKASSGTWTYTLEPRGSGTLLRMEAEWSSGVLADIGAILLWPLTRRSRAEANRRLATRVERWSATRSAMSDGSAS